MSTRAPSVANADWTPQPLCPAEQVRHGVIVDRFRAIRRKALRRARGRTAW